MSTQGDQKYLTATEAGEYIGGRSAGAVRNLVMRKAIPFRKPGGRLLFIREELDEWIQTSSGIKIDELLEKRR
ncbi:hypothetical protein DSCW_01860 [Desulfosarcina widdelii]|uniref:Helix-turn-helix domain-containing protein n=1 Tax=Desulfosarcina widdelii TaxID=947919 RepID=A0A5K7YXL5_9BACT|nr:helix-turn-helix domain-containing protein [Desulfosarcina widdelii]BBO72769.1 hypothetical protein DSCW_01860 [Desulfosarcina widdelii]